MYQIFYPIRPLSPRPSRNAIFLNLNAVKTPILSISSTPKVTPRTLKEKNTIHTNFSTAWKSLGKKLHTAGRFFIGNHYPSPPSDLRLISRPSPRWMLGPDQGRTYGEPTQGRTGLGYDLGQVQPVQWSVTTPTSSTPGWKRRGWKMLHRYTAREPTLDRSILWGCERQTPPHTVAKVTKDPVKKTRNLKKRPKKKTHPIRETGRSGAHFGGERAGRVGKFASEEFRCDFSNRPG